MRHRVKWILAVLVCLAFALPATGLAEPKNIKFGTNQPFTHVAYKGYMKFKELVEKRSDGQIVITTLPERPVGLSHKRRYQRV